MVCPGSSDMKRLVLCCLLASAAAGTVKKESDGAAGTPKTDLSESDYPDSIKDMLQDALVERPKKARQIFETGTYIGGSRAGKTKARSDDAAEDVAKAAAAGDDQKKAEKAAVDGIGQEVGWRPLALRFAKRQKSRSLTAAKEQKAEPAAADAAGSDAEGKSADADGEEDREAENSYLSPHFAPAPGGYGGYGGYGGGPYIYILPIVLPPVPHHGHAARHVVTETGHESHHYSGPPALPPVGHGEYHPIYAGSHNVPPIYIPKGYGGAHTTVHHDKSGDSGPIIRDIDPPIFSA